MTIGGEVLNRQKVILGLLSKAGRPLGRTQLVKLLFLLKQSPELERISGFYDFLPYKYGPFSFSLYRELADLQKNGYVANSEERIELASAAAQASEVLAAELPKSVQDVVDTTWREFGKLSHNALIRIVYKSYPWYATRSELPERILGNQRQVANAGIAIYTAGYERMSVDHFFNNLLQWGIMTIVDVRANPISRKYGFAGRRLREFCERLGMGYCHFPQLGISSTMRVGLGSKSSYNELFKRYVSDILPRNEPAIRDVAQVVMRSPSVLVCVERLTECCHRSHLADWLARRTNLEIVHL